MVSAHVGPRETKQQCLQLPPRSLKSGHERVAEGACGRDWFEELRKGRTRRVTVVGDSEARRVYESLWFRLLPPSEQVNYTAAQLAKHSVAQPQPPERGSSSQQATDYPRITGKAQGACHSGILGSTHCTLSTRSKGASLWDRRAARGSPH